MLAAVDRGRRHRPGLKFHLKVNASPPVTCTA